VSVVRNLTFDCADPVLMAHFWAAVLEYDADSIEQDEETAFVEDPTGGRPGLLFIVVPERKTSKNRIHFDLTPASTRDQEVERIRALGATISDDRRNPDGTGWVVMRDPEGNEFCVERTPEERAAAPAAGG
jgi:predicted enzyme related to lactoylglutathione lyase